MDNNDIHILHNNTDEKASFPGELISELLLGRGVALSSMDTQVEAPRPSFKAALIAGESLMVTETRMVPSKLDQRWAGMGKVQEYLLPHTHTRGPGPAALTWARLSSAGKLYAGPSKEQRVPKLRREIPTGFSC